MGKDPVLNINLCIKLVTPFILSLIQRVKTVLFSKSNSMSSCVGGHGILNSATEKPFGLCHFCSNYCGAMTIPQKICSCFAQHIVHGISHKSLHKYHSLCESSFGLVGNIYILSLFVKHMILWICCAFHGNHKVQDKFKRCLQ